MRRRGGERGVRLRLSHILKANGFTDTCHFGVLGAGLIDKYGGGCVPSTSGERPPTGWARDCIMDHRCPVDVLHNARVSVYDLLSFHTCMCTCMYGIDTCNDEI